MGGAHDDARLVPQQLQEGPRRFEVDGPARDARCARAAPGLVVVQIGPDPTQIEVVERFAVVPEHEHESSQEIRVGPGLFAEELRRDRGVAGLAAPDEPVDQRARHGGPGGAIGGAQARDRARIPVHGLGDHPHDESARGSRRERWSAKRLAACRAP